MEKVRALLELSALDAAVGFGIYNIEIITTVR